MSPRKLLATACPKPKPAPPKKRLFSSIVDHRSLSEKREAQRKLRPTKHVVAINRKRKAKNHRRAYGAHAAYIRSRPCCVCGVIGYTEAAHTTTGGMGRKAHRKHLVPLCGPHNIDSPAFPLLGVLYEGCHRKLHRVGAATFAELHRRVNLKKVAEQYWDASPERGEA